MYPCPHCEKQSISGLSKWWANSFFPAKCSSCSGLSHVSVRTSNLILMFCIFLLALNAAVATSYHSLTGGVLGCIVVFTIYIYLWHRVKLSTKTPEQLAVQKRFVWAYAILEMLK